MHKALFAKATWYERRRERRRNERGNHGNHVRRLPTVGESSDSGGDEQYADKHVSPNATGCAQQPFRACRQTLADIVIIVLCIVFLLLLLNDSLEKRGVNLNTIFVTAIDQLSKQTYKSEFLANYPTMHRIRNKTIAHLTHLARLTNHTAHRWSTKAANGNDWKDF